MPDHLEILAEQVEDFARAARAVIETLSLIHI